MVNMHLLDSIDFLLGKIDRWWIREVEMTANPDYAGQNTDAIPDSKGKRGGAGNVMVIIGRCVQT